MLLGEQGTKQREHINGHLKRSRDVTLTVLSSSVMVCWSKRPCSDPQSSKKMPERVRRDQRLTKVSITGCVLKEFTQCVNFTWQKKLSGVTFYLTGTLLGCISPRFISLNESEMGYLTEPASG